MTRSSTRVAPLAVLLLLLIVGACATLRPPPPEWDAALHLTRGLDALEAGRYVGAYDQLAWVATHCPTQEAGAHARVGLAAVELDPRNPVGRPDVGMRLLADMILGPTTPAPIRVLAETTYLLGLGLGAPAPPAGAPRRVEAVAGEAADPGVADSDATEDAPPTARPTEEARRRPIHGCGRELPVTETLQAGLPELPGPSLAAMLRGAEERGRALETEAEELREEVSRLRQQLEETRAELARIRRTLRP
jgi:hypothetical protein